MATEPWPAIRREVEELWNCRLTGLASDRNAAIAALNARVEALGVELLMREHHRQYGVKRVLDEYRQRVSVLLNEEPDDA